jgi:hypothetical protein
MKKLILLASLMVITSSLAVKSVAGELDDEKSVSNQQLEGTVIVRVDTRDNSSAFVMKADGKFANENEAQAAAADSKYTAMPSERVKSELDQDGGSSSWYFYNNYYGCGYYCNYNNYGYGYNYNYNYSMNWYGNYYNPVYSYNNGNYNYYYYCRNRWW